MAHVLSNFRWSAIHCDGVMKTNKNHDFSLKMSIVVEIAKKGILLALGDQICCVISAYVGLQCQYMLPKPQR